MSLLVSAACDSPVIRSRKGPMLGLGSRYCSDMSPSYRYLAAMGALLILQASGALTFARLELCCTSRPAQRRTPPWPCRAWPAEGGSSMFMCGRATRALDHHSGRSYVSHRLAMRLFRMPAAETYLLLQNPNPRRAPTPSSQVAL